MLLTCIQSNSITLYLFVFLNCSFKLYFLSSVPAALFSIVFLSCISCAVLNRISCAFLLYFSTVFLVYFSTVFRRCSVNYQLSRHGLPHPHSSPFLCSLYLPFFFFWSILHLLSASPISSSSSSFWWSSYFFWFLGASSASFWSKASESIHSCAVFRSIGCQDGLLYLYVFFTCIFVFSLFVFIIEFYLYASQSLYLCVLRSVEIHQRSTGPRLINRTLNPHTPPTEAGTHQCGHHHHRHHHNH